MFTWEQKVFAEALQSRIAAAMKFVLVGVARAGSPAMDATADNEKAELLRAARGRIA